MSEWFKHNGRLKVAALFIATVVWIFVNGITNDRRTVQAIPLEVRTRPGVTVLQQTPLMVDVVVRGTREDMRQVSRDDLVAVLDLSREEGTGEINRRLGPGVVRHPRWVQAVEVAPARATVVIDGIVERDARVDVQWTGTPAAGWEVAEASVKPAAIRLVGPQLRVGELSVVQTLPVDLSQRTGNFRERVEIDPDGLADVSLQRRWVEVEVRLRPSAPPEEQPE